MKKIYKYGTGHEVPEGAIYLNTVIQKEIELQSEWAKSWLVWHYFLVEVKEEIKN